MASRTQMLAVRVEMRLDSPYQAPRIRCQDLAACYGRDQA